MQVKMTKRKKITTRIKKEKGWEIKRNEKEGMRGP